jgi:hypothetical protein
MTNLARFAALAGRLDTALTAELIMVPTPLLQLTDQDEEARVAGEMDQSTYDVLPRDRLISSYWVRADLVCYGDGRRPIHRLLGAQDLVAAGTPVSTILELMVSYERGFYFVLDGAQVIGLVDFADLNRLAFRTAFYAIVMESEVTLRRLIEATYPDGEEWWQWLNNQARGRIEHYWNEARNQDVHLEKIHYTSLGDLTTIICRSPKLAPRLAETLGATWENDLRHLQRSSRDAIAHPGKVLVSSPHGLAEVYRDYRFAQEVTKSLGKRTPNVTSPTPIESAASRDVGGSVHQ